MQCPYWGLEGFYFYFWVWVRFFYSAWRGEVLFFGFVVSHGIGNVHGIFFAAVKCNSFVLVYLGNSRKS